MTRPATNNAPTTWDAARAGFMNWLLATGRTQNLATRYGRWIRLLGEAHAHESPWVLTADQLANWVAGEPWERRREVSAAVRPRDTSTLIEAALRAFYDYGTELGALAVSPAPGARPAPTSAWSQAHREFIDWLVASGRTRSTAEGYGRWVLKLGERYPLTSPWSLTTTQITSWIDAQGWARSTYGRVLVALRTFYSYGTVLGTVEWSPIAGVQIPDAKRSGPARRELPAAWEAAIGAYLLTLRAGAREESTIAGYRARLANLATVSRDPWAITPDQLVAWLASPGWSPATRRGARVAAAGFYRWARQAGHVTTSPAEDLPAIRVRRALPRPIPDDVLREALCNVDDLARIAMMLAALAGLRRAEIAGLHYRDVNTDHLHIVGKGGHHRRVPLAPDLAEELNAERWRRTVARPGAGFLRAATADGYVFPSSQGGHLTPHYLAKLVTAHLPEGWTLHTLRHRFATRAYLAQRDLRAVQELLGHSKPETTARYAAVPDGALRAAVIAVAL